MTIEVVEKFAGRPQLGAGRGTLIGLPMLMDRSAGIPAVAVSLIDGPVALDHPDLANSNIRSLSGAAACLQASSIACRHGTMVAGVLHAKRDSPAPGICPGCTLFVRPILAEAAIVEQPDGLPSATLAEVEAAILEAIDTGTRIINLSVGLADPGPCSERAIAQALDETARRGVIVVAAAGNQGVLGSSVITRHPWVIPVVACDRLGRPMALSNLGASIGRRGLAAPGEGIESLAAGSGRARFSGTSVAVPFVVGTIALLWSVFPNASAARMRMLVMGSVRRRSVTPPLLNAWAAYQALAAIST